jgi:cation transport regulator ChaB
MLYSEEELPESVFKSLLAAPHARRIFTQAYDRVWKSARIGRVKDDDKRNEIAVTEAWRAVKEAYGLSY